MTARVIRATKRHRYIILGAGAAGLSLCLALLERGIRDPVLILDRKTAFLDDRTWCFWNVRPTPFADVAAHCWHRWDVFDDAGRRAAQTSPSVGYACLRGLDFYTSVLETIRRHDNVTLRLGCPVGECQSFADHAAVRAGAATYEADYVFDSRPRPLPVGGSHITLAQRFFGQFIQTEAPCFDPSRCTLMDFRAPQTNGLHFFYALPFSPTETLVENTYIQDPQASPLSPEGHRAEIAAYLSGRLGLTQYDVVREEAGAIPMTTRLFSRRDGRVFFIGTAGGCTKPSSGYTFQRIQEQCRQLADAVVRGKLECFGERPAAARYRFFDAVFLQAMQDDPAAFPGYFQRLFQRIPPDALTAFLSETSTWRSDSQIIQSLPVKPFLRAAVRAMRHGLWPPRACGPG